MPAANKQRTIDDFRPAPEEDAEDPWTREEEIKAAHRIMQRLGIEGDLCDPFAGVRDEYLQKLQ